MSTAVPSAKETAAAMETLRKLVALVARAYYEPKHIIVLDILSRVNSQREEEITTAMGLPAKEVQKICGKLKTDGLVKVETRTEAVGPALENKPQRKINKSYYYIDYKTFVDVVKWKIYKIGKNIEKEVQTQMANMPYRCAKCRTEYSALDFASLEKTQDMVPLCRLCKVPVESGSTGVNSAGVSEKYTKFMDESVPIVELLKQTDKFIIPEWVSDTDTIGLTSASGTADQINLAYSQDMGAVPAKIVIEVEDGNGNTRGDQGEGRRRIDQYDSGDDAIAEHYAKLQADSDRTANGKHKLEDGDLDENEPDIQRELSAVVDDEFEDEEFEEV